MKIRFFCKKIKKFQQKNTRNFKILYCGPTRFFASLRIRSIENEKDRRVLLVDKSNFKKKFQNSPGFDNSECGKSKGCTMPQADSCYNLNGGIGASYRVVTNTAIEFEIFGPANTTVNQNVYVALGFSNDEKMVLARHGSYNRALLKPKKIACEIERLREKETFFKGFRWSAVVITASTLYDD